MRLLFYCSLVGDAQLPVLLEGRVRRWRCSPVLPGLTGSRRRRLGKSGLVSSELGGHSDQTIIKLRPSPARAADKKIEIFLQLRVKTSRQSQTVNPCPATAPSLLYWKLTTILLITFHSGGRNNYIYFYKCMKKEK